LVLVIFYGKSLSDYFPLPLQLFLHCFFFFSEIWIKSIDLIREETPGIYGKMTKQWDWEMLQARFKLVSSAWAPQQ